MTRLLAAIDETATDATVLSAADALGDLLGADVEVVRAQRVRELLEAAAKDDVVLLVAGATAASMKVASAAHKPVAVVPPNVRTPMEIRRILVPVDGTRETAEALSPTFELAYRAELTVIALHVLDYADLPLFSDQPHYEAEAWAREFLRRHFPHPELVRLEVRVGAPTEHVRRLADEAAVDLVVLGWAQRLGEGHAGVVRDVVAGSRVPVLLVPVAVSEQAEPQPVRRLASAAPD